MNLRTSLTQNQSQKLVMTQDLRQSIELLALSTVELSNRIQEELIENPLLEDKNSDEKLKTPELYSSNEVQRIEKANYLKETEMNWGDSYSIDNPKFLNQEASDRNQKYIESSSYHVSLTEHLLSQLRLIDITDEEFYLCEILISLLDRNGFITIPIEDLASETSVPVNEWDRVLKIIHELDPIGIGAKDIQETLGIQARILSPENHILHKLIEEHLSDLEKYDYKKIAKSLNLTEDKIIENARHIKKLEPYPATLYQTKKADYIVPDAIIRESSGDFDIFINDEWIPRLELVKDYKEFLNERSSHKDKEFIYSKLNSANWLIRSVAKRRETLQKTLSAIVDTQKDFFNLGTSFTKPSTLKDIAEKTSLSESTISRITTNKYVQTKWGIFELKWFFSSGIKGSGDGNYTSSKKIQELLIEMVKDENEIEPLSDQDIVDSFAKQGIDIARRTIAKYRKILRILPSHLRKKTHQFRG